MVGMLGTPPVSHFNETTVMLPCDEELWDAPDAETWAKLMASRPNGEPRTPPTTLSLALSSALHGEQLHEGLNDFSASIVAHSLHRWVIL